MAMLKFGAIDLDHRLRGVQKGFGSGFHYSGLPDPVGPRKRKFPIGRPDGHCPAMWILVEADNLTDGFILSASQTVEFVLKFLRMLSGFRGIQ
jgi:hypothetical protein